MKLFYLGRFKYIFADLQFPEVSDVAIAREVRGPAAIFLSYIYFKKPPKIQKFETFFTSVVPIDISLISVRNFFSFLLLYFYLFRVHVNSLES